MKTPDPKVLFVQLRRPRSVADARDDPFYEFGSFGCTGCHRRNLLHPRNATALEGARLAFVQGGKEGTRLVFLTPPVKVKKWVDRCEVRWVPISMPFVYVQAPVLVKNDGISDFPAVKDWVAGGNRSTAVGQLSSNIRSRTSPLPKEIAFQIIAAYEDARPNGRIAKHYAEALPSLLNVRLSRMERRAKYATLTSKLRLSADKEGGGCK